MTLRKYADDTLFDRPSALGQVGISRAVNSGVLYHEKMNGGLGSTWVETVSFSVFEPLRYSGAVF